MKTTNEAGRCILLNMINETPDAMVCAVLRAVGFSDVVIEQAIGDLLDAGQIRSTTVEIAGRHVPALVCVDRTKFCPF